MGVWMTVFVVMELNVYLLAAEPQHAQNVNKQRSKAGQEEQGKTNKHQKSPEATVTQAAPASPPTAHKGQVGTDRKEIATRGEAGSNNKQQGNDWFDWYAAFGPSRWADLAVAVLAAVAGFIAYCNLKAMRHQLRLANVQMRASRMAANAARRSANIANEANRLGKESLEITQRARISIKNVEFKPLMATHDTRINGYGVEYQLQNTGQLPATGMIDRVSIRELPRTSIPNKRDVYVPPRDESEGNIINGQMTTYNSDFLSIPTSHHKTPLIPHEKWVLFMQGKIEILVCIHVSYWDGFHKIRVSESWHTYDASRQMWVRIAHRQE